MATNSTIRTAGVHHETRDVNLPALAIFAGVLCLTIAVALIGMRFLFFSYAKARPRGLVPAPFATTRILPPEPRLQPNPAADLAIYIAGQKHELATYGWMDRKNGVVHIPIERAMQRLLKQGLPVNASGQTATQTVQSASGSTNRSGGKKSRERQHQSKVIRAGGKD